MSQLRLHSVDRPDVPPIAISPRLRGQLVYFMGTPATDHEPPLGDGEYWFDAGEVADWLDQGVFYLVSPLDSANKTEVELSEEQEVLFAWLHRYQVQHVRLSE